MPSKASSVYTINFPEQPEKWDYCAKFKRVVMAYEPYVLLT